MPPHNPPRHQELEGKTRISEKRTASTSGTRGRRLPKMHKSVFSPPFHPQDKMKKSAPALLTDLATGPKELQGHHLTAKRSLHPRGCKQESAAGPSPTSSPRCRPASPPRALLGRAALLGNTYQKASNFTRAPRDEKHLRREVSGRSTFLSVLHREPLPQRAPRAQPLAPPPGRAGRGNRNFKGH